MQHTRAGKHRGHHHTTPDLGGGLVVQTCSRRRSPNRRAVGRSQTAMPPTTALTLDSPAPPPHWALLERELLDGITAVWVASVRSPCRNFSKKNPCCLPRRGASSSSSITSIKRQASGSGPRGGVGTTGPMTAPSANNCPVDLGASVAAPTSPA
eukprot:SAG31_NODE_138_length_22877_cov_29.540917_17_plen_154_part_00